MISKLTTESILVVLGLALVQHINAEIEWNPSNPSLSETDKARIRKHLEEIEAKMRAGYLLGEIRIDRAGSVLCWVGVRGYTNLTAYRPLPAQAFDAHLFDESGKEIKKTRYGRQFGRAPQPDTKLLDGTFRKDPEAWRGQSRELIFDKGGGGIWYWQFNLSKAFQVKEAGQYLLQVEVRLFVKDTNGVFRPLILPPVEKQVDILMSDLH